MDKRTRALPIMQNGPRPNSFWRHYKGGEYEVIANALDEATLTHLVVYRASDNTTWVRTIDDWNVMVDVNGIPTRRFAEINI